MRSHLRDEHPMRLAYALVRISNGSANSHQQPSIIQFENSEAAFKFMPLTGAQLNFMEPALQSPFNECDPALNVNSPYIVEQNRMKFIEFYNYEAANAELIKKRHNIASIESLLKGPASKKSENEEPTPEPLTPNASPSITPNPANLNEKSDDVQRGIQLEIDKAAEVVLRVTMSGAVEPNELFRCAFTNCDWMKSDEREFLMHLSQHTCTEYICYHCKQSFAMPVELKNHIKSHLKHRFFCYYCDMTGATQQDLNSHFKNIHGIDDIQYRPLNPENYDIARDLFVVYPSGKSLNPFITSLTKRADDMKESKKVYFPSEIDLLPKYQIFKEEIQCGLCSFRNKVRQNLVRHFLTSCNGQQAPVNPVPCLNTGERHFDKMRNLAASSNSSNPNNIEHGLGKYVPDKDRYVCSANSCEYRNVSAEMLKQHIVTVHELDRSFSCPHCGEDLSNSSSATEIMSHLRYHESKIFKCPTCPFVHYLKPQVEKHINELHPNSKERAKALERPLKKDDTSRAAAKSGIQKWNCNVCSTMFNTRALAKAHLSAEHRLQFQFKCSICSFGHETKTAIKEHLASKHNTNDSSKVKSHYEKIECDVDNTPIWRRDDPNRVSLISSFEFLFISHAFKIFIFQAFSLINHIHLIV